MIGRNGRGGTDNGSATIDCVVADAPLKSDSKGKQIYFTHGKFNRNILIGCLEVAFEDRKLIEIYGNVLSLIVEEGNIQTDSDLMRVTSKFCEAFNRPQDYWMIHVTYRWQRMAQYKTNLLKHP